MLQFRHGAPGQWYYPLCRWESEAAASHGGLRGLFGTLNPSTGFRRQVYTHTHIHTYTHTHTERERERERERLKQKKATKT